MSRREVRALPYPEFHDWQIMYMLEPWGWHDAEFRTASIIAKLHNVNVSKKKDLKEPAFFMRDMEKIIVEHLEKIRKENDMPSLEEMDPEERKRLVKKSMKEFFGVG